MPSKRRSFGTKPVRVFFALDPPPPVCERIAEVRRNLGWSAREVPQRNLHLTLVFVGDVAPSDLPLLLDIAARRAMSSASTPSA